MHHSPASPTRHLELACGAAGKLCPISGGPCPGECIFADIMASVGLGIVLFDLGARSVPFANQWAREFFARVGVPVEYEVMERLLLIERPDSLAHSEARQLRLANRFLGYSVYAARGFAWVFVRDITDKARLEAVAAAVETTNNIGYVFSAVRHELGNPINSIKIALGVLEANLGSYSRETIADYVTRMSNEVARVEHLLRSLRSFSLYELPEVAPVDLSRLLHESCELVRPEVRSRGIELDCRVEPGVTALCDPRALHQVLLNLVTNATDALDGRPAPRITIHSARTDSLVVLRVEDNGAGISEEQKAELFTPFNTTKPHGTGLGLVIARKLLASMDATISIESALGEGSVVSIAMPACGSPEVPS
jgi:signal transduction histidine kinase